MRLLNIVTILIISVGFSGCADLMFKRSFVDEMEKEDDSWFQPGKDFPVMGGDRGAAHRSRRQIMARTPAFPKEEKRRKHASSLRSELHEKVEDMQPNERQQFRSVQTRLNSESEQLYYLSLPNSERRNYLRSRSPASKGAGRELAFMQIHKNRGGDLFQGMNKSEVKKAWGNPYRVEFAGNPDHQNERWTFYRDGQLREVYFEQGQVDGWSID